LPEFKRTARIGQDFLCRLVGPYSMPALSMTCASQIEPRPSILLICSNESTSLEYASAAKLQEQHSRDSGILRHWSAARSSGMSTVKVTGKKIRHLSSSSKSKKLNSSCWSISAQAFRSLLMLVLELSRYFQSLGLENCKNRKVGLVN